MQKSIEISVQFVQIFFEYHTITLDPVISDTILYRMTSPQGVFPSGGLRGAGASNRQHA